MRYVTALGIAAAPVAILIGTFLIDDWQDECRGDARQRNLQAFCDVSALAEAVETYRANHGALPVDLEAIATSPGALDLRPGGRQSMVDPWSRAYRYERNESVAGFRVFTLGRDNEPDGELDSADQDQSAP